MRAERAAASFFLPPRKTVRFRVSLVLKTSPTTSLLLSDERLRIPKAQPPLLKFGPSARAAETDTTDMTGCSIEVEVPINGKKQTYLGIDDGVTSENYKDHRTAGQISWHPAYPDAGGQSGAGPSRVRRRPENEKALFRLRIEPIEPTVAAAHPQLARETAFFEIISRRRQAAKYTRSLSASVTDLMNVGPSTASSRRCRSLTSSMASLTVAGAGGKKSADGRPPCRPLISSIAGDPAPRALSTCPVIYVD